ncbi:MAG: peptide chain release factor N(5)-glutamine methyltransferase [Pseudomonadota bacterium]
MIVRDALRAARDALAGIDGGERDARWLLAAALGVKRDRLTIMADDTVPEDAAARLADMVGQRVARVPVSHLVGEREFYGRAFHVTADALDPRPETETLVAACLEGPLTHILDLGTGSGAILLTLLAERPRTTGVGTDISLGALALAEKNARRLGVVKRGQVIRSDWFEYVDGEYDLIVSNPPYIPEHAMATLAPELSYEPRLALTDEGDGLSAYRVIFAEAAPFLAPGGRIIVEFGAGQGPNVEAIAQASGWRARSFRQDLDGRDRVLVAKRGDEGGF